MSGLSDLSIANYMTFKVNNVEITDIEAFSGLGEETSIVEVKTFNTKMARKLVAGGTVAAAEMTCSFIPESPSFKALTAARVSETPQTCELTYWSNAAKTEGTKRTFQGIVTSESIAGELDTQRTVTYSIAVDGALGALTAATPAK